jgi:hypothetical protein
MLTKQQIRPRLSPDEYSKLLEARGKSNTGIIADTHAPFTHPAYLDFCHVIFDKFHCGRIVHIGDEVDNHALSYHDKDPDGHSAGSEAEAAQRELDRWYARFPETYVCIGNHSQLLFRKAMTHGIPKKFLKDYPEQWNAPKGWRWQFDWEFDGVLYQHGTGTTGKTAHELRAQHNRQSTVIGHTHAHGGVKYLASKKDLIFGMNVGCGIDIDAYAFAYGRPFPIRPILGCGVVLDEGRVAAFIPMKL